MSEFSSYDHRQYGMDILGPNPQQTLRLMVQQDHGLPAEQKQQLLQFLLQPDSLGKLLTGAAGAYLMNIAGKYINLGTPTRTLLSLAGFGLGNILYKTIFHTSPVVYKDPQSGYEHIKL